MAFLIELTDDELRRRTRSVWRLSLRADNEKIADFLGASGSSESRHFDHEKWLGMRNRFTPQVEHAH